ncbi:hypothetical protein Hanom_Chr13g01186711 [Helianthus anomalus]
MSVPFTSLVPTLILHFDSFTFVYFFPSTFLGCPVVFFQSIYKLNSIHEKASVPPPNLPKKRRKILLLFRLRLMDKDLDFFTILYHHRHRSTYLHRPNRETGVGGGRARVPRIGSLNVAMLVALKRIVSGNVPDSLRFMRK